MKTYTDKDFENSLPYWKELAELHHAESKALEKKLAIAREALELAINDNDLYAFYEMLPKLKEALEKIKAP